MTVRWLVSLVLSALFVRTLCIPMETASIYMKKADFDDMKASETGYVFRSNSDGPVGYTDLSDTAGDELNFRHQIPYGIQQLPLQTLVGQAQYVPEGVLQPPLNSYGVPVEYSRYILPTLNHQGLHNVDLHATVNGVPTILDGKLTRYGLGGHSRGGDGELSEGHHFIKEGGQEYDSAKRASHGEKGETGYKNVEGYDKGSQGNHEDDHHKGYYAQAGGNQASHHDAGENYGKKEESAKGTKGESYSHSSSHKKGSKTTGFHKVYHKDEYKKDHSFYDEADTRGHYDKHEKYDSNHASEEGAAKKGGHHEAGYKEHDKGAQGHTDKGHYVDNSSGFKGAQGQQSYHNDASEYAKKEGQAAEQEEGYNQQRGEKHVL